MNPLGKTVLVPVANPASAVGLMRLAALLAASDGGTVVPVTVLDPAASEDASASAERLILRAEEDIRATGVDALGLVVTEESVVEGVLEAAAERRATLVLMGWHGSSTVANAFGRLIDSLMGRSSIPLAVVRLDPSPFHRVVLPVAEDHLAPAGERGLRLAADIARRLHAGTAARSLVLRSGPGGPTLPAYVTDLSDRVHHDQRRVDVALGGIARSDDLIVMPVAPTVDGLRIATRHVAWAAPHGSLLVAVDVGPTGQPTPITADKAIEDDADRTGLESHAVVVTVRLPAPRDGAATSLEAVLHGVGDVANLEAWQERGGVPCLHCTVTVAAVDANTALGAVMTAMHDTEAFRGTEIRYDLA